MYGSKEQAFNEFNRLNGRAFWHQIFSTLRGQSAELDSFDAIRDTHHLCSQHDLGVQEVNVEEIIGTVGRTADFDDTFNPKQERSRERWAGVASAIYDGKALPPIDLYHVDDAYYVIDGNHRVSVMKSLGQQFVEAHVIEIEFCDEICQTQEMPTPQIEC